MATEWNFNYTGNSQNITLKPGKYKLECWGAKGGRKGQALGGGALGGYASGDLILRKETTLYIYVGECGFAPASRHAYNGGGVGSYACGGGATDIRLPHNSTWWDDLKGLLSRILVAGGGGASSENNGGGGVGGGVKGANAFSVLGYLAPGGTQYDGGRGTNEYCDGLFGFGGASVKNYYNRCKYGAGGGWFGGAGSDLEGGAGGGSGYALTKDSYKPKGYIPTSEYWLENVTLTAGANTENANGYAKITLLQSLPILNINSYSSVRAMFKADHTDVSLLSKIEVFIDNVLKQTITTDLSLDKTVEYTLEDNALHTLKIVVADKNNFTAEKSVTISKGIAPLPANSSVEDVTNKWREISTSFKSGKTSIINTLALKNIHATLNNTLLELSERIKMFFDSSDATAEQLQNQITNLNNQLSQRIKWASGTFVASEKTNTPFIIPINLTFVPKIVIITTSTFLDSSSPALSVEGGSVSNLNNIHHNASWVGSTKVASFMTRIENISESSFTVTGGSTNSAIKFPVYVSKGSSIKWYAFDII
ncbi:glycine rich domain-containing protein [Clostridioides difficile]